MVLRICVDCGLEAIVKTDLMKFKKGRSSKHGRRNLCRNCYNKRAREDPYYKEYRRKHADRKLKYLREWRNRPSVRPTYLLSTKWRNIKNRCTKPEDKNYPNYGGRGITMCPKWLNNKKAFIQWALTHGFKEELQIDRIDNNKGYSPENCRFVTSKQQSRNRRTNITDFKNKTRICQRCKTKKPLTEYYKNKNAALKRSYICIPCETQRREQRRLKPKPRHEVPPQGFYIG